MNTVQDNKAISQIQPLFNIHQKDMAGIKSQEVKLNFFKEDY